MQTEFEAKFFIDIDPVITKIQIAGGACKRVKGLMRRVVFSIADQSNSWLRVRDEGVYVSMTLKSFDETQGIESVQELEIQVSDFEIACQMLQNLGYQQQMYCENYREVWQLDDCQLMIDWWPALDPIIEIEGTSKLSVHNVSDLLGFDMSQAMYGPTRLMYQEKYGLSVDQFKQIKRLTFDEIPDCLKKGEEPALS